MEQKEKIKTLFVGGMFDDKRGKESKIAETIFLVIKPEFAYYYNGGNYRELQMIIKEIEDYRLIYWLADIPNDKPKLVQDIKTRNKECVFSHFEKKC